MESITYKGKHFELNDNDNNANIRVNVLDDDLMRLAGFTDHIDGQWYYGRELREEAPGISFNIMINKKNTEDWRIDILDEAFLQPYDYQAMLQTEYEGCEFDGDYHHKVNKMVEYVMEHLKRLGILNGWERGDYI